MTSDVDSEVEAHPWKSRAAVWTAAAIITLGIALRLRQYVFNRSLWLDETLVSLNIIQRDAMGLLGPLDNHQAAPAGFLVLEHAIVRVFGPSEYALRLVPLLAGIASLYLFYRVLRLSVGHLATFVALGLFALSPTQIDYSNEVKQYSSDVAITLALLLAALSIHRVPLPSKKQLAGTGLLGAVAIWCSHPAAFVLAGVGSCLGIFAWREKNWSKLWSLVAVGAVWSASAAACYILTLRAVRQDTFLAGMWTQAFVPWDSGLYWAAGWFLGVFFGIFRHPADIYLSGLGVYCFLIAIFVRTTPIAKQQLIIAISPACVALLAAGLHLYPFEGRFLLFLVPSILLSVAVGVAYVNSITNQASIVGAALVALLFFDLAWNALPFIRHPQTKEEVRSVFDYVQQHKRQGDVLYLYWRTEPAFEFYVVRTGRYPALQEARRRNWSSPAGSTSGDLDVLGETSGWALVQQFTRELEALRGTPRVWFIFDHVRTGALNEQEWYLQYLDGMGRKLDVMTAPGASAYLYDLTPDRP